MPGLKESVDEIFGLQPPIDDWMQEEAVEPEMIVDRVLALADAAMEEKIRDVDLDRCVSEVHLMAAAIAAANDREAHLVPPSALGSPGTP